MLKIENVEVVGWEAAIRGMRNPMNSWDKSDTKWDGTVEYFSGKPVLNIGPNDLKLMKKLVKAGTDHRKFMRFIDVYLDITAPLYWWKEFDTYRAGVIPGGYNPNPFDIEMNSCSTMHKIHSKKFELDDFSHEHLVDLCESLDIWRKNHNLDLQIYDDDPSKYLEDASEFWSFAPLDVLNKIVIKGLNRYRELYLKTKDKKYWWQMIQLLPSSYNQRRTIKLNYEVLANIYKSRRHHKLDEWHVVCDWIETLPYSELITGEEDPKLAYADQPGLALGA